jgi:multidrug efflux pump subunit AcrB
MGVISYTQMSVDFLPNMNFPFLVVVTVSPGLSPTEIETQVTDYIEDAVQGIQKIDSLMSISMEHASIVIIQFKSDANLDTAVLDIQTALGNTQSSLPAGTADSMITKINPTMLPIMNLTIAENGKSIGDASEYLRSIYEGLRRVDGVSTVDENGLVENMAYIVMSQEKLTTSIKQQLFDENQSLSDVEFDTEDGEKSYNDTLTEIASSLATEISKMLTSDMVGLALYAQNLEVPAGSINENIASYLVKVGDKITSAEQLESLPLMTVDFEQIFTGYQETLDALNSIRVYQSTLDILKDIGDEEGLYQKTLNAIEDEYNELLDTTDSQYFEYVNGGWVDGVKQEGYYVIRSSVIKIFRDIAALKPTETGGGYNVNYDNVIWSTIATALDIDKAELFNIIDRLPLVQVDRDEEDKPIKIVFDESATFLFEWAENFAEDLSTIEITDSDVEEVALLISEAKQMGREAKKYIEDVIEHELKTNTELFSIVYVEEDGVVTDVVDYYKINTTYIEMLKDLPELKLTIGAFAEVYHLNTASKILNLINGSQGVMVSVNKQPDYSTVDVTNAVKEYLGAEVSKNPDFEYLILSDQGDSVMMMIRSLVQNILIGMGLAIIILFIFLRDVRATLIVALSMVISIIAAFVLMYFSGIALNILSLSGLCLGVGMLVDNSIVVLENIYKLRSEGKSVYRACVQGAKEMGGAIMASTLTTVIVFVPLFFLKGMTQQLISDIALTLTFSLAASLLIALTLVPMASSYLLKKPAKKESKWFDNIKNFYGNVLERILKYRLVVDFAKPAPGSQERFSPFKWVLSEEKASMSEEAKDAIRAQRYASKEAIQQLKAKRAEEEKNIEKQEKANIMLLTGLEKEKAKSDAITRKFVAMQTLKTEINAIKQQEIERLQNEKSARKEQAAQLKHSKSRKQTSKSQTLSINLKVVAIALTLILFIGAGAGLLSMKRIFFPATDAGAFTLTISIDRNELPPDMTYDESVKSIIDTVYQYAKSLKDVTSVGVELGKGMNLMGVSMGAGDITAYVKLKSGTKRSSEEVAKELRAKCNVYLPNISPDAYTVTYNADSGALGSLGDMMSGNTLTILITGDDIDAMRDQALLLTEKIDAKGIKGLTSVDSGLTDADQEYHIVIDKDKAAAAGKTVGEIYQILSAEFAEPTLATTVNYSKTATEGDPEGLFDVIVYKSAYALERWYMLDSSLGVKQKVYIQKNAATGKDEYYVDLGKENPTIPVSYNAGTNNYTYEFNGVTVKLVSPEEIPVVYYEISRPEDIDLIRYPISSSISLGEFLGTSLGYDVNVQLWQICADESFTSDENGIKYKTTGEFELGIDGLPERDDDGNFIPIYEYLEDGAGNLVLDEDGNKIKIPESFKKQLGYTSINHDDGIVQLSVTAKVDIENYNIATVSAQVEQVMNEFRNTLPEGINVAFQGEEPMIIEVYETLILVLAIGILLIYLVMVAQFQSFRLPFIIMFTIPLAFTGSVFALMATGIPISIVAMVGLIILMGVVVNNGIVFIDNVRRLIDSGLSKKDALVKTARDRLRPILMTALTTIIALFGMAVDSSASGAMMQPMGIATLGGLLYATFLTLFIVPIMFDILDKGRKSRFAEEKDDDEFAKEDAMPATIAVANVVGATPNANYLVADQFVQIEKAVNVEDPVTVSEQYSSMPNIEIDPIYTEVYETEKIESPSQAEISIDLEPQKTEPEVCEVPSTPGSVQEDNETADKG